MEFLWLEYFKAVAEKGKISDAANDLFISPPALSSTISRLEKELGVRLFDRTHNRIVLNEQGRVFLRYTNQILSSLEYAKNELRSSLENNSSHIRIAMTNANLWVGLLCAFSAELPQITLSNTSPKLSQIASENISPKYSFLFAEERDIPYNSNYEHLTLIENDRPVLMLNPSHPLARSGGVNLGSLANETLCLPVADMSLNKMVRSLLSLANIRLDNAYEYPYMLRRSLVIQKNGVSFSTEYTSKNEEGGGVCFVPISIPTYPLRHSVYWDKGKVLSREEQTFLDFCVDYFKNYNPRAST